MSKDIYRIDKDLKKLISNLKSEKKKIVFTNGVFDIIHRGHVEYLKQAKTLGDVLIVGLNSDTSTKIIKGENRPLNSEMDRALVLVNLKPVDYVVIFDEDNPLDLIKSVIPEVLVKGGDWKPENIVGADFVKENGGEVISLDYINNYSTTNIIKKIAEN